MRRALLASSLIFLLVVCVSDEGKNNRELTMLIHAAEAGDAESMYSIFFLIAQKGSPEHPQTDEEIKLAQHWLVKAGENNNWRAAHVLQLCYEVGCWWLPIDHEKSKHYKAVLEKYGPLKSLLLSDCFSMNCFERLSGDLRPRADYYANQSFNRNVQQQALNPVGGSSRTRHPFRLNTQLGSEFTSGLGGFPASMVELLN